jgi:putative FmdB family regulatory protein
MPIYEYECRTCGGFTESRPMAASALPSTCPRCSLIAPRVLSATALGRTSRARRRGRPEPKLVTTTNREPRTPKERPLVREAQRPHAGRPWMMGH